MDYIGGPTEPSGSSEAKLQPVLDELTNSNNPVTQSKNIKRKRSCQKDGETEPDRWKENFCRSMQGIEEEKHNVEMKMLKLKCYNLMLRNMALEKELGMFCSI